MHQTIPFHTFISHWFSITINHMFFIISFLLLIIFILFSLFLYYVNFLSRLFLFSYIFIIFLRRFKRVINAIQKKLYSLVSKYAPSDCSTGNENRTIFTETVFVWLYRGSLYIFFLFFILLLHVLPQQQIYSSNFFIHSALLCCLLVCVCVPHYHTLIWCWFLSISLSLIWLEVVLNGSCCFHLS